MTYSPAKKEGSVDIVICVHNSPEDVARCYESARSTIYEGGDVRIILVDDGSDAITRDYLKNVVMEDSNSILIRREKAGGYTIAANTGLRASTAEFCALLNSDTIVPRGWLTKMTSLFREKPDVGIVGPLSNAASWQSVPERSQPEGGWAVNSLPENYTVDTMDREVERASKTVPATVRVPLLNGFCFVIRSSILETVGYMDEQGFPRGFGEEDDFCIRAENAGFGLAVAIDTYVFHAKSKSYGSKARNELTQKGQVTLKKKHGADRLLRAVETMKHNPYLADMRRALSHLSSG